MCVCVCICVIVSLIRLADDIMLQKKSSEDLIQRKRRFFFFFKRDRSQQTGKEVIKTSLKNPVELASINSRPLLLPASPPFSFAVPSLSSNCFMHFPSELFGQCMFAALYWAHLRLYPFLFLASSCSHGYLMALSIFRIVQGLHLIARVP